METEKDGFRRIMLGLMCINGFAVGFSIYCMPSLYVEISQQIPLTKTQMGMLMSSFKFAMLFGFFSGSISDRIGARMGFGSAVLIIGIAGAMRGFTDNATALIICMFFVGIGMATLVPSTAKTLGAWFAPQKLAFTNGICTATVGIGSAVGVGISASLLSPYLGGWRNTLILIGAVSSTLALIWLLFMKENRESQGHTVKQGKIFLNVRAVFKSANLQKLCLYNALMMVNFIGIVALLPVSLMERGIDRAGELVSIFVIMSSVSAIPIGILSDKIGKRKPFLLIAACLLAICTILYSVVEGIYLVIALFIGGSAIGAYIPLLSVMPVESREIDPGLSATAVGTVIAFGSIGGGIGPPIVGKIIDLTLSQWPGFIVMSVVSFAAAIVVIRVQETGK